MTPVFSIEGKVCPCLDRSGFVYCRYDEAEVFHNVFIVGMQYASASSLLVTPRGKKFCGKNVIIIVCHFSDES